MDKTRKNKKNCMVWVDCVFYFFRESFSVQLTGPGRCLSELNSEEAEGVWDFHVGDGNVFLFELSGGLLSSSC